MCTRIKPCELLVIEDSPELIRTLDSQAQRDFCLNMGLRYVIAPTLKDAKAILSATAAGYFDAILIDPVLPDSGDPKNTFDAIHSLTPECVKFVYTGGVNQEFIDYVLSQGAEQVILKGEWSPIQLFTLLHYGAGQARARKSLKIERDSWREAAKAALKKSSDLVKKYESLERDNHNVTTTPAVQSLKGSIDALVSELKGLSATH